MEKKPCTSHDGKASAAVSKVLDNDDLLVEILLRVAFPTTLVCAAAVCTRWLHQVSDRGFLRRFRKLHPPRLLGFYTVDANRPGARRLPHFVPMLPHAPELATVVRRANSTFDAYQRNNSPARIIDCRNGSALVELHDGRGWSTVGVHGLLCHERGMVIVPQFPSPRLRLHTVSQLLSKEEDGEEGRLSYLYVSTQGTTRSKPTLLIHMLQDGVWRMHHTLSTEYLLDPWWRRKYVFVGNRIYMQAIGGNIIVLDLTASRVSTIQPPKGVEYRGTKTILSRADDAADVYLIHVEQLLLRIWLHSGDEWLLVDTICLREMCASLDLLDRDASLWINQVGDNAEFVFLEMSRWLLYLDIKARTLRKVYKSPIVDPLAKMGGIYPFMMIWPPTFPALQHDHVRFASWT